MNSFRDIYQGIYPDFKNIILSPHKVWKSPPNGGRIPSCPLRLLETLREGLKKHQPATSTATIIENFETEVLGMFYLMDADNMTSVCGILGHSQKSEST